MIRFGPSGNEAAFYEKGLKSTLQAPDYVASMGLNAYEYSCGRGITIGQQTAEKIGAAFAQKNIAMSVHAPYFINFCSEDEEKQQKSCDYVLRSAEVCRWMGAKRLVVHVGSCAKMDRDKATTLAHSGMGRALESLAEAGFEDVLLCPETMGKVQQWGTLDEILGLCRVYPSLVPTFDFGHLHSRGQGSITSRADFAKVLDTAEAAIGFERASTMHMHFSKQAFTKGGEKHHVDFADVSYGPSFEHLAPELAARGWVPVIICESATSQASDAYLMKRYYEAEKVRMQAKEP